MADENVQDVLNIVNKIRLLLPDKTIWLYTGYTWEEIINDTKRKEIVSMCDVVVDGQYKDNKRDITLKWRGSQNQRVIDIQATLKYNRVVLHET